MWLSCYKNTNNVLNSKPYFLEFLHPATSHFTGSRVFLGVTEFIHVPTEGRLDVSHFSLLHTAQRISLSLSPHAPARGFLGQGVELGSLRESGALHIFDLEGRHLTLPRASGSFPISRCPCFPVPSIITVLIRLRKSQDIVILFQFWISLNYEVGSAPSDMFNAIWVQTLWPCTCCLFLTHFFFLLILANPS